MLAKIHSACVSGVDGMLVEVEVDISRGLPTFSTVAWQKVPCEKVRIG